MLLLNFSHPLTDEQKQRIEALAGQPVTRLIDIPSQIEPRQPLVQQIEAMAGAAGLTPEQWQTEPLLVVPPALNFSAATLLAHLHGLAGYFPPVVRLRPIAGSLPPRYEVAEIIDLQSVRSQARKKRS